jgi:long-chain fatty acid transport protein
MESRTLRTLVKAALVGAVAAVPTASFAAGFSLTEQSVAGLGRSFAGGAAWANDASTLFYNPAGILRLKQEEVVTGVSLISLGADFDKTLAVDPIGQNVSGGEGGSVGKLGGVPTLYYVQPYSDRVAFGIGMNAPFGLATDYERDSIFRYQAVYSNVAIINIQPTVAYKVNENLSVGFGVDVQYMRVKLQNEIDFGSVCFGVVGPVTCTNAGLTPQAADGAVTLEGDSFGYGWNVGVLVENGGTRLGLSYRSSVSHDLEGTGDFERVPVLFTNLGLFTDSSITAAFDTPEIFMIGLVQEVNDAWTLSLDITRTGWDKFRELRVVYGNPSQPDTVQPENWKDVYKASLGVDWRFNDAWTFRAGYGYDNTPLEDEDRTARLPDGDRTWISVGATWRWSDTMEFNAAWAHLDLASGNTINFDQYGPAQDHVVGTFEADAEILGLEMRWKF